MVLKNPDKHLKNLMSAFDFTADDLAENIENRMTQRQQNRLRQTYYMNKWVITGVIAGVVLFGIFCGAVGSRNNPDSAVPVFLAVLCGSSLLGFLGLVAWSNQRIIHQDITDVVVMVCGKLQKSMPESLSTSHRYAFTVKTPVIEIQDQQFFVTKAQYQAVVDGLPYCIYYADASQTILSIRPIKPIDDEPFTK